MLRWMKYLPSSFCKKLIRSRVRIDEQALANVNVRLAQTEAELLGAAGVLHDTFVARGILQPHLSGLHLRKHSASPNVMVFLATDGGRAVGTLSLVIDSNDGLPMDPIYAGELERFRAADEIVAEVGGLALAPDYRHTGLVLLLNKIMFHAAKSNGVDRLVVAVHPDAAILYEELLMFEQFGGEKMYPGLDGTANPRACALCSPLVPEMPALFRQKFDHLGKKTANGYYFYCECESPQITFPTTFNPRSTTFRRARRAMVAARPDVVARRASLLATGETRASANMKVVQEATGNRERVGVTASPDTTNPDTGNPTRAGRG